MHDRDVVHKRNGPIAASCRWVFPQCCLSNSWARKTFDHPDFMTKALGDFDTLFTDLRYSSHENKGMDWWIPPLWFHGYPSWPFPPTLSRLDCCSTDYNSFWQAMKPVCRNLSSSSLCTKPNVPRANYAMATKRDHNGHVTSNESARKKLSIVTWSFVWNTEIVVNINPEII